ncbi:MAG: Rrf2 family transcriptional regulator [Candidatus Eisenbacteria bacterium]|nr:Rrf2 family transcriptional regulator [Candidatus Latescibacterota bacterium]MBD3302901.1 Rrf2 family transcriptional regulator [Candidatus Eisenbacteria bacterium]
MRINPSEEYGLRCLLQLAREHARGESLSLQEIASREGLPVPNTAKLLRRLRIAGIVTSERGRSGGYLLARPPAEINLAEVLRALDGPVFDQARDCGHFTGAESVCVNSAGCSVRSLWIAIDGLVRGALEKVTLADLATTENRARDRFDSAWDRDAEQFTGAAVRERESRTKTR